MANGPTPRCFINTVKTMVGMPIQLIYWGFFIWKLSSTSICGKSFNYIDTLLTTATQSYWKYTLTSQTRRQKFFAVFSPSSSESVRFFEPSDHFILFSMSRWNFFWAFGPPSTITRFISRSKTTQPTQMSRIFFYSPSSRFVCFYHFRHN